jgi:FkbM family methyltransferase
MTHDDVSVNIGTFLSKTGIVSLPIKQHRSGLYYRDGILSDLEAIRQCYQNYKDVQVVNRIVLDLGANVGGFSYMALTNGAKEVHSVEPEAHTYAMLVKNVENFTNVSTYNRVVSDSDEKLLSFYVGVGGTAPVLASTSKIRGRKRFDVVNENFKSMVDRIQPTTIKMDIEGSEYKIIKDIPDSCTELALEWHCVNRNEQVLFDQVYPDFIQNNGWTIVNERRHNFFKSNNQNFARWTIDSHYRR